MVGEPIANWSLHGPWRPRQVEIVDWVTPNVAAAFHGLLDQTGKPPQEGSVLPPLWHWLAFHAATPQRELGADGHARLGGFLPPIEGARRMFGGCTVEVLADVRVGERLRRVSQVVDVVAKEGRSGPLTIVSIMHEIYGGTRLSIREVTDLVYSRRAAGEWRPASPHSAPELNWPWVGELLTTSVTLFRFSALTYNAHRIHYDREYARQTEGYPGLVVHGPLQAIALAELCRQHIGRRRMRAFVYRAVRPAFDGDTLALRGQMDPRMGRAELVALTTDGHRTGTAEARLG